MKQLFFLLVCLGMSVFSKAQTFTLNNNAVCHVYFDIYYTDANNDPYVYGNKIYPGFSECNTSTYVAGCNLLQGVPPFTFQYIYIYSFQGCVQGTPTSGCPNADWTWIGGMNASYPASDCFESTTNCNTCKSGNVVTGTWTDLTGGDVQVDFN